MFPGTNWNTLVSEYGIFNSNWAIRTLKLWFQENELKLKTLLYLTWVGVWPIRCWFQGVHWKMKTHIRLIFFTSSDHKVTHPHMHNQFSKWTSSDLMTCQKRNRLCRHLLNSELFLEFVLLEVKKIQWKKKWTFLHLTV